jgi:hypothetical protein
MPGQYENENESGQYENESGSENESESEFGSGSGSGSEHGSDMEYEYGSESANLYRTACPICQEPSQIMVSMNCGHGSCAACMVKWYARCLNTGKMVECMHCRAPAHSLLLCNGGIFDTVNRSVIQINNIMQKSASKSNDAIDLTDECAAISEWANQVIII